MKIDPAMYMKTNGDGQNVGLKNGHRCTIEGILAENGGFDKDNLPEICRKLVFSNCRITESQNH